MIEKVKEHGFQFTGHFFQSGHFFQLGICKTYD